MTIPSLAVAIATGCADPSSAVGLDEPDPAANVRAVRHAAVENDRESAAVLIRALESDDAAVRLLAIHSLERRTGGETFGYDHAASRDAREAAVQRWVDWYKAQ